MTKERPLPNRFMTLLAQVFQEKKRADALSTAWLWDREQASALEALCGGLLACLAILEAIQCDADFPETIAAILHDLSKHSNEPHEIGGEHG